MLIVTLLQVWYNVEGFLDKNRDTLRYDVMGLLIGSKDKIISKMFQDLRNFQVREEQSVVYLPNILSRRPELHEHNQVGRHRGDDSHEPCVVDAEVAVGGHRVGPGQATGQQLQTMPMSLWRLLLSIHGAEEVVDPVAKSAAKILDLLNVN